MHVFKGGEDIERKAPFFNSNLNVCELGFIFLLENLSGPNHCSHKSLSELKHSFLLYGTFKKNGERPD